MVQSKVVCELCECACACAYVPVQELEENPGLVFQSYSESTWRPQGLA